MGLVKLVIRIMSIVGKEIVEGFRRPGALLSLILVPSLILAACGFGYQGVKRDLQALVVIQPESQLPSDLETYRSLGVRGVNVVDVVADRAAAEQRLKSGEVDVVIAPPTDPLASVEAGQQAEL